MYNAITDVPGIEVGHYTDTEHATGCTVVMYRAGAMGGVDVRGSAPGTRETDLLRPTFRSQEVHAVLLSGGSAFGLDAAGGVVRYLEEQGVGVKVGRHRIPIVPAAILFDLNLVTARVRPSPEEGYKACLDARSGPVDEGSVGAGTGATVGKALTFDRAVKGGIGAASLDVGGGVVVGALVAVNAIGSIVDPETGQIIAGPRKENGDGYYDTIRLITSPDFSRGPEEGPVNTTIGVVATNANLTKEQTNKLASSAQDGLAMAVRPAHTMGDGDCMFALATRQNKNEVSMVRLGAAAALCVSQAIVRAVEKAQGLGGVSSVSELENADSK